MVPVMAVTLLRLHLREDLCPETAPVESAQHR